MVECDDVDDDDDFDDDNFNCVIGCGL